MDIAEYAKFIAALAFVIALIGGLGWIVKRSGVLPTALMKRKSGETPRLKVKEVLLLDAKRRLVLVQRDDVEHLLLLGTDGESVVERGIAMSSTSHSASGTDVNTGENGREGDGA